ncbi:hypothetical protein BDA99DRAFT_522406, partial [Phascolomyces articulosus]
MLVYKLNLLPFLIHLIITLQAIVSSESNTQAVFFSVIYLGGTYVVMSVYYYIYIYI